MVPKKVFSRVAFGVYLILFSYLAFEFVGGRIFRERAQNTDQRVEIKKENRGLPVRLVIPKINVDAQIEYLGLNSLGEMEVPSDILNAGWFKSGPIPGEIGNAVMAGHFNGEKGEEGVFAKLNKLQKGDKLYVENSAGKVISFTVREKNSFNPGYAEEVFAQNDMAHLNLITCDGMWDENKKSYSKRLVIFTDITDQFSTP